MDFGIPTLLPGQENAVTLEESASRRNLILWPRAALALPLVFCLGFRLGLLLHVAREVWTTAGKRHNMVHNVTFASMRVSALAHEISLRFGTALYSTVLLMPGRRDSFPDAVMPSTSMLRGGRERYAENEQKE